MPADPCEPTFAPDPDEPLGFSLRHQPSPGAEAGVDTHFFEYSSRGDRVPGRLRLPEGGAAPFPLVLLQGQSERDERDASELEDAAARWVRGGAAVASIDLPLHGERESAKLSALLLDAVRGPSVLDALGEALLTDFTRQAVVDLRRSLDALATLPEIESERVVFSGFGLGASAGAIFCAFDNRPRAAALALCLGGKAPAATNPLSFIDRCRAPLLFVGPKGDEGDPGATTRALFEAAPHPKEMLWLDGAQGALPGSALDAVWKFLQPHLALE